MTTHAEQERIEANLATIRAHLRSKFPGDVVTEASVSNFHQKFTVMNASLRTHHKLTGFWERLSYHGNTPTTIQSELERDDMAGKMRRARDHFCGDFSAWLNRLLFLSHFKRSELAV